MSKKALIETILANNEGMTQKEADRAVDAFTTAVTDMLKKGEDVSLQGFGKFASVAKPEREARNPATGGTVHIPAHNAPKFTAAKNLKDALKG